MSAFWTNIVAWDKQAILQVNTLHNPVLDRFFWLLSDTMVWLPVALLLLYVLVRNKKVESLFILLVMALMFVLTDFAVSEWVKPLVARPRPTRDMMLIPLLETVFDYHGGSYGFPSNHASNVFAVAMFTTLLLRDRWYGWSIFLWAALVSFSRVYLAVHYPTDVFCGAAYGVLIGWLAWWLYSRWLHYKGLYKKPHVARDAYTVSFYRRTDVSLLTVMLWTLVVALLLAAMALK